MFRCLFRPHRWKRLGDVRLCERCIVTEMSDGAGGWKRIGGDVQQLALRRWWRALDRERTRAERGVVSFEETINELRRRIDAVA